MTSSSSRPSPVKRTAERWFYVWVGLALALGVTTVIIGWHAAGGTPDPSVRADALHMSRATAVINSAVLVFREGLETILVLAAVTASFRGSSARYRRPVTVGAALGIAATIGTWFAAVGILGIFGGTGLTLQAATGIPA